MNTTATFAGGCFWCTEHDLRSIAGVTNVVSGYARTDTPQPPLKEGELHYPTYENHEGYREAVQVTYDPAIVSFKKLCQFFLDHIDPTDSGGQFYDRGESYKTAIYFSLDQEQAIAQKLIQELQDSGLYPNEIIAVQVLPFINFYPAESYHQDYAHQNPVHYESYAKGSGHVTFVANTCAVRDQKKINWKD